MNSLLNSIAFYLVWFVCLYGATHQYSFWALALVFLVLGIHLFYARHHSEEIFKHDLLLIFFSVIVGSAMEISFLLNQLHTYASPNPFWEFFPPFWIIALYAFFGTTINSSMKWLKDRIKFAFVLGFVGGPLCYWSAAKVDAVKFSAPLIDAYAVLALAWGCFLAAIFWFQKRMA